MRDIVEKYNKIKKTIFISKVYNGTYTSNDLLEFAINSKIDSTSQKRAQKEYEKIKVSGLKELAERFNGK